MAGRIRVGMSGFSYPSWVGSLYPSGTRTSQMLERYAERLDAVELNVTARRTPEEKTVRQWQGSVGDDFRFAVKLPMVITHMRRLQNTGPDVAAFTDRIRLLGDRLGPLLVQMPPDLPFDAQRLDGFLASLPGDLEAAVEPRHASHHAPEFLEVLRRSGAAWALNDDLAEPSAYRTTGPVAYLRMRRDAYDRRSLDGLARTVRRLARTADVYVFFKHEDRPDAPEPALKLRQILR